MPRPGNRLTSLLRWISPCEEYNASLAPRNHSVDDFLREALPPFARVAVGLMRADRQAGVEEEDATVCPGGEQAAFVRWGFEGWIVLFQRDVDVFETWRGWGGRADGEAEAVGLVNVVVRVLAYDDGFDGVEGGVAGPVEVLLGVLFEGLWGVQGQGGCIPAIHVFTGREDLLARLSFLFEEPLQI